MYDLPQTQVWISDLMGIIPSITGKIELVYEGRAGRTVPGSPSPAGKSVEDHLRSVFSKPGRQPEKETTKKNRHRR